MRFTSSVVRGQRIEAQEAQLSMALKSKPQGEAAALPTSHLRFNLRALNISSNTSDAIVMENTFDKTAVETIDLLEARLRRIEYAVCGQVDESALSSHKISAAQRLATLEHSLHQLASKSRVVQDLLRLREFIRTERNVF